MPITKPAIPKVIVISLLKVLRKNEPFKWTDLQDIEVNKTFAGLAEPNGWPGFFAEAVAMTLQNEIIVRTSYVPGLEEEFVKMAESQDKKWRDVYTFISQNAQEIVPPERKLT